MMRLSKEIRKDPGDPVQKGGGKSRGEDRSGRKKPRKEKGGMVVENFNGSTSFHGVKLSMSKDDNRTGRPM